jgi:alkylhydroperoxidase/carboxymuconolactone decarboxylase family protein YurZ
MNNHKTIISNVFQTFLLEAPNHAEVWNKAVQGLASVSALDQKTGELAFLAVLAALRLETGVPLHVKLAKEAGATREEVISAVLVGMPAAGHCVTRVLPIALEAYDAN